MVKLFRFLARGLFLLPVLCIAVLSVACVYIWNSYRNVLMQNQEEQLLLVTQSAGENVETMFSQYWKDLEFLFYFHETSDDEMALYTSYLELNKSHVIDVCLMDRAT